MAITSGGVEIVSWAQLPLLICSYKCFHVWVRNIPGALLVVIA